MPLETLMGPLGEVRAASTPAGGTALASVAVTTVFPAGTNYVSLEARNYATAVVVQYALTPYILVYKTGDSLATITDYSADAQDGSVATDVVLSSLDTLANGDSLWVGATLPFRGLVADVDAANGNSSVMTGVYWTVSSALANISLTDGTLSGGVSLAVDGTITWTVPTDWTPAKLTTIGSAAGTIPFSSMDLYWVRLVFSGALDSSTTLNSLMALSRSTAYAELISGRVVEMAVRRELGGVVGVEALAPGGTANLLVNCAVRQGGRFL